MPPTAPPNIVLKEVQEDVYKKYGKVAEAQVRIIPFNPSVLGFVRLGSNVINVNAIPLSQIPSNRVHDYLYVVISHEYFHLLGIYDERETRKVTMELVDWKFGEGSYASSLAKNLAFQEDVEIMKARKMFPKFI